MTMTIKEIARISGVSRGTVDRVLHNRPGVVPEVRQRVQHIIDELHYEPNAAAVALRRTEKNLTIGVIIPDLQNEFFHDVYEGIRDAARRCRGYGVRVEEYRMADATGEELVRGIDILLEKDVDGIALQGLDEPVVRQRLKSLPAGFPIVTFNNDLPGSGRLCFVGQNSGAAGKAAGHMMQMFLRKKGTVAIITGTAALTHQTERINGFCNAVKDSSEILGLIGPVETHESEETAYHVCEEILKKEPDLVGIYAAGGGQKSIAAALARSGRAKDIIFIGHDLLPKTVEYLRSDIVDCTIAQEPFKQGTLPIEILSDYLLYGRRPPAEKLYTMVDIRIRENAQFNGVEKFMSYESKKER